MDIHDWPYIKKSARRKKRLVKKDFDRRLIRLDKLQDDLWERRRKLPMVPVEKPYQRGWMRLFLLRDDIKRSDGAVFYETLLNKINTVWYHPDKSFKRRKIRKRRYLYKEKKQVLREFDHVEFHGKKFNFSDAEKECFYLKEIWNDRYWRWETTYALIDTWRFVLTIKPRMIYKVRQIDELLEQELSEIENYIKYNHLHPRLARIKGKGYRYWKVDSFEKPQYINPLKNQPRYATKEAYLDY